MRRHHTFRLSDRTRSTEAPHPTKSTRQEQQEPQSFHQGRVAASVVTDADTHLPCCAVDQLVDHAIARLSNITLRDAEFRRVNIRQKLGMKREEKLPVVFLGGYEGPTMFP